MMLHRTLLSVAFLGMIAMSLACSGDDDATTDKKSRSIDDSPNTDQSAATDKSPATDESPNSGGVDALPPLPSDVTLPIVFAHGGAGSAQQYASQAIRFAANGYPQERIVAYDHDGAGFDVAPFLDGLDSVIDDARERFDSEKVYLVGHSRGTLLSSMYLSDETRRAKVAKYISLDGAPCPAEIGIPCIGPNQAMLPGQKHVEVATSKESFAMQYEFLVGEPPKVVDIVKQAAPVEISGRAVNFPQNTGRDGTKLDFWEIDHQTGERQGRTPIQSFDIGTDGTWGPLRVDPDKYYELVLYAPDGATYQHFYPQRFLRSSRLERLLSGPPDSPSRVNSNVSPDHTGLVVLRMREWLPSDVLTIGSRGEKEIEERNVITEDNVTKMTMAVGSGGGGVGEPIAIYIQDDAATPKESTLAKLPYFPDQFFQTGIDLYLPAADPPDSTITITSLPRGNADKPQTLNVPNWRLSDHTVSVVFADYPQD